MDRSYKTLILILYNFFFFLRIWGIRKDKRERNSKQDPVIYLRL